MRHLWRSLRITDADRVNLLTFSDQFRSAQLKLGLPILTTHRLSASTNA
ncbi:hypothetical protein [Pontibacillus halophilus]|nr:hypothetical protein [Pontibacillus halophilus]